MHTSLGQTLTDGGFENSPTSAVWGINNGSTFFNGTYSTTTPRTGAKKFLSGSFYNSTNSTAYRDDYLQNSTAISMGTNTYLHIIAWATASSTTAKIWFSTNTASNYYGTRNVTAAFARYDVDIPSSDLTATGNQIQIGFSTASGTGRIFQLEDVIAYADQTATTDLIKPLLPTAFNNGTISSSSIGFSWTNGSDAGTGIQNTIILRTTNLSAVTPVMNDQGIYSTSGTTLGPKTVSTDWTVLSTTVGASTLSYTDASVTSGTSYKYAVIHRDLAFNYSTALVSGTIIASSSCTQPSTQTASLTANTSTTTTSNYAFTRGNGNNVLVVARLNATAEAAPTSGTTYTPSTTGSFTGTTTTGTGNIVVYNGSAAGISTATGNLSLTNLTAGSYYTLTAYEYNTTSTCYNTTSPATVSFYTLCSAPTSSTPTVFGSKSFTATWGSVTAASSYKLDVSIANDFSSFISGFNNLTVLGTSQVVTGLNYNTTYYFRVRAINTGNVASTDSNISSTTTKTAASSLVLVSVPSTGSVATNLTSFTVEARRSDATVDDAYTNTISITKESGNGVITGNGAVAAAIGIATFSSVQFDAVGTYSISATDAVLTSSISGNIVVSLLNSTINPWVNTSTTTTWCTTSNWSNTTAPSNSEVAQFNDSGTSVLAGITFSNCTPIILGIEMTSIRTRALSIGSQSSASGSLTLTGGIINNLANVILRNASASNLTLNPNNSNTGAMSLALGNINENLVCIEGNGSINISCIVSGSNKKLTKAGSGSGSLVLTGANTYTGLTTVSTGILQLNKSGGTTIPVTNSVSVSGGTLQVSSNQTLSDLTISSGGLTIDDGVTLTINGTLTYSGGTINYGSTPTGKLIIASSGKMIVSSGIFTTSGNVTLKSDANGTAIIGNSAGTITGNVTVERYIPAKRAWRALTAPVSTASSIYLNWQEAGTSNGANGLEIWAPIAGTGLTQGGVSNSLLGYNSTGNSWTGIAATDGVSSMMNGTKNKPFMAFVTGPYGTGNISAGATATTLRATGTLFTGDVTYSSLSSTNYTLIGNPYASPISPSLLLAGNTSFGNNLWIWDANAAGTYGVGAYNSYDKTANTYTNVTNNTVFASTPDIQSGQAFFVIASSAPSTLTISESFKSSSATATTNIFLRDAAPAQLLRVGLYKQTNTEWSGRDGAMAVFISDAEANQAPNKMANGSENIAFTKNAELFSSEHHLPLVASDVLNVKVWNTTAGSNYKLKINTEQFNTTNLNGTLEDLFTNSRTPIALDGTAVEYPFAVTADAASSGNRFRIVFENSTLGSINPKVGGIKVLPNPITGDAFQVNLGTLDIGTYSYTISNTLGQEVEKGSINNVSQNTSYAVKFKNGTAAGMYIMKVIGTDNSVFTAKLIKK